MRHTCLCARHRKDTETNRRGCVKCKELLVHIYDDDNNV